MSWILWALLATGCGAKLFYLPGEGGSDWKQAGRLANARAFLSAGLDPPLQLLWEQKVDASPVGSPVFAGYAVLQLTTSSSLYAFDRHSGQRLGKKGFDVVPCAAPALAGEILVLSAVGKEAGLYAFDRRTRKVRRIFEEKVCTPLVVSGDTLLVAGEDGYVRALRIASGEELWQTSAGRAWTAPSAGNGMVYVGNGEGVIAGLDASSGEKLWRRELESGVRTRPVVGVGRIFAGTSAGKVVALDAASGDLLWEKELGVLLTPGMALGQGALVVGAVDHRLYGLDAESGALLWEYETGGVVRGSPAVAGKTVYCGSSDGQIYALEVASGRLLWEYRLDGPAITPVALGDREVAITSEEGTIYVFGRY